jgi:hypothetical protein
MTDFTSAELTEATTPARPGGFREVVYAVIFSAAVLGVLGLIAFFINASASAAGGCGGG